MVSLRLATSEQKLGIGCHFLKFGDWKIPDFVFSCSGGARLVCAYSLTPGGELEAVPIVIGAVDTAVAWIGVSG